MPLANRNQPNGNQGIDCFQQADENERCIDTEFTAAQVKAAATTPLVLVNAPGANRAIYYSDGLMQIFGGTANHSVDASLTVNYQLTGAGAAVSTAVTGITNQAAGVLKTIKQVTTDIIPEVNQPLVLKFGSSMAGSTGDRRIKVRIFYSVYDVRTGL